MSSVLARPVRRSLTVAATALLTAIPVVAQAPASSAAPPGQAARAAERLDRALDEVVEAGAVGTVAEVTTRGHVWRGASGKARLDPGRPARPWAKFRAASVTKSTISVLALQMVARGRWTLRTTIGDVLPRLWPKRSEVTLRQLLSHTSGMPDMLIPLVADAVTTEAFVAAISKRRTDRELIRTAKAQPWLFEPGTDMAYSNAGYVVVGKMLRKATGRSVADLLRTRVLAPAGMTDTRFARSPDVSPPWLREYADYQGELLDIGSAHPTMFSSAGALLTTTRDLNRFHRALSSGRLLPNRLVRKMRSVVAVEEVLGLEYGLGSYRVPDPCRPGRFLHGHDGGAWGTYTFSFSSPNGQRRVTVAATGRSYDGGTEPLAAVGRFLQLALASACPDVTPPARSPLPAPAERSVSSAAPRR